MTAREGSLEAPTRHPLDWKNAEFWSEDAAFHELLASGSGNEMAVDIVRRQNRLRRLAEYVSYGRLERIQASMKEHMAIIDALLRDDRNWAAAMLRQHLSVSSTETTQNYARDLEAIRAGANRLQLTE